jgi:hypothetical protein
MLFNLYPAHPATAKTRATFRGRLIGALSLLLCYPLLAATPPVPQTPSKQTPVAPAAPLTAATPAAALNTNKELALKIWTLTNGDKTLSHIKAGLGGSESQMSLSIDKSMAEKIIAVLNQAFDPVPAQIQGYVAEKANPEQLTAIIKWLESFYGKKVREAEAKSQIQYNDLERNVPLKEPKFSKEREALYKRYERVALEATNKIITETVEFYLVINNSTKPPTERIAPKELEQTLKLNRVKMQSLTQQLLPHLFAATYRDLIVDEVKVYVDFLETPAGQSYLQLNSDAYVHALRKTRPEVLLKLAGIFEDELAVLSPYSKETFSEAKQNQLMVTMLKRFGKAALVSAILEVRGGQITILRNNQEQEVFGRPNQDFITVNTLMKDMRKAKLDIRRYYQLVQKHARQG